MEHFDQQWVEFSSGRGMPPRRPRDSLAEKDLEDLLIGAYFAEFDLTYEAIGALIGKSPAEVGRALGRLRKDERLRTEVVYSDDPEHAEWTRAQVFLRMRDHKAEAALKKEYRDAFEPLVIHSDPEDRAGNNVRRCGWLAARRLLDYLDEHPDATIGITWGFTLSEVLRGLEQQLALTGKKYPQATIFNLCGDIIMAANAAERLDARRPQHPLAPGTRARRSLSRWSSTLAKRLADALEAPLYLFTAPGWLPLNVERGGGFAKMLMQYDSFKRIFDDPNGLAFQADVLLTGLGDREILEALLSDTNRLLYPVTKKALDKVIGDMAGVLLTPDGVATSPEAERLSQSFIGCHAEHFERVARAARKQPGKLGVMAVVENKGKAEVIKAAAKAGLINVLVTESAVAEAMQGG